ncbi:MAG: ABC transporter ATP-binding protein [Lentisphaerae bacterium]|nr:ABC transporter ATP-binding protein [Lentisphaerota bacterium]MBQ4328180.1 ABC transporter ATP-binding protein [Lentisphaeria bacterium]
MNNIVLELANIRHAYRMGKNSLEILKGVNFKLFQGEWCCIYGASGSGKTTLLNLIGGLEQPTSGTVTVGGVDPAQLSRRSAAKFRAQNIGFIFQSYHLLPELTALENVAIAGTIAGKSFRESKKLAGELLEKVGLADRMMHHPKELSGGEQQRTAIARSLINSPALLLADEPTGNLDPHTGETILELFKSLRKSDPDLTILMITHNLEIAQLASRSVKLQEGILCD